MTTFIFAKADNDFSFVLLPTCLTSLTVGGLYAYSDVNPLLEKRLSQILSILLPVAIVLYFVNHFGHKLTQIRLINSIIAINLIIYTVKENYNTVTSFLLNNRALNYLGKISYGIYLYHYTLPGLSDNLVDYLNENFYFSQQTLKILKYPPPAYIFHFILLLVLAHISYVFIELKFVNIKRCFSYNSHSD